MNGDDSAPDTGLPIVNRGVSFCRRTRALVGAAAGVEDTGEGSRFMWDRIIGMLFVSDAMSRMKSAMFSC
jgi:hypothetical protein